MTDQSLLGQLRRCLTQLEIDIEARPAAPRDRWVAEIRQLISLMGDSSTGRTVVNQSGQVSADKCPG